MCIDVAEYGRDIASSKAAISYFESSKGTL
jgi:hypothetical protein